MTTETGQKRSALEKVLLVWEGIVGMMVQGQRDPGEVLEHIQEIKASSNFRKKVSVVGSDAKSQLRSWAKFYKKFFGTELDTRKIRVPARQEGFNWLIVLAKGLSNNTIFAEMGKHFLCWKYTDDLNTITSVRVNTETYAIWVRERVEADEELKNRSADDLKAGSVNCITLPERLVLELYYWANNNQKHLDLQNVTLCAGSRLSVGHVPYVYWHDGRLAVGWDYSYDRSGGLRSRQAVS